MKKESHFPTSYATTIARKILKSRGRLALFVLLAIVLAAGAVTSISLAQSNKSARGKAARSVKTRQADSRQQQPTLTAVESGPKRASAGQVTRAVQGEQENGEQRREVKITPRTEPLNLRAKELRLNRAKPFDGDLRGLPSVPQEARLRINKEKVVPSPSTFTPEGANAVEEVEAEAQSSVAPGASNPAPAPINSFEALGRTGGWGNGYPPDPSGDVGPNHYIQGINTALAIYDKTGNLMAGPFSFNTFMSQGQFGNLCDTANFGDPIILYDTFEDRWIVTDFAFQLDASNNVKSPSMQCFAVSKTGDPVAGGWNYYSITRTDGMNDYPKLGVWTDGIYMSANMFSFGAGSYQGTIVWAFNKAQMYAGAATAQIAEFNVGSGDFTLMPSNARLQTGTPPPGTPNYFLSSWNYLNALTAYKFKVDWNKISLSSFTGPEVISAGSSWPDAATPAAGQSGTTQTLDTLGIRAMMQNHYSNINGVESLWMPHTVRRVNTTGAAAPRWYQVNVTGGTVAPNLPQAATWDPDGNNNIHRFMPSLAVDRMGNMAIGYTASGTAMFPSIRYAGRLATDPVNTFSQLEQTLFAGTGSQTTYNRWGDYTHMTLDPDGCTFWYTNEYLTATGTTYRTRVGSFKFNQCTPVGNGSLEGTVTANGNPLSGVTVTLGSRTATTDSNGFYAFPTLPAGTYPNATASKSGFTSHSVNTIVISENGTATRNFTLTNSQASGCLVDTTQSDFQNGIPTSVDLNGSPGNVTLLNAEGINQQNTDVSTSGFGFSNTTWFMQSFTPSATGTITKAEVQMFCSACSGTAPNVTISIRNTTSGLPSGADLVAATVPFTTSNSSSGFVANFATPVTLTGGVQYAIVVRTTAAMTGTPAYVVSESNPYAGGRRATSSNSGGSWAFPTGNANSNNDIGFKVTMKTGFAASGNFVSGIKDANPASGTTPTWGTLSWNATTPASTNIQFQVAASNNPAGPFTYVGPNGTASTFFTSGGSLAQFNGSRYLRYRATFTGTSTATPTLADATVCFENGTQTVTNLVAQAASGTFGGTTTFSATLTASGSPLSGHTVSFTRNGTGVGSATTDASGVATLSNVSLAGVNAGSYPNGVGASFAASGLLTGSTGTAALTVNKAGQSITFGTLANKTFGDANFTVSATASSGLAVSFSASGNCTMTGSTVSITGAGSCTITASQAGNTNYEAATSVERTFSIAKAATTTTVTANNAAYNGSPRGGTASVTGAGGLNQSLTVTYTGRNGTTYGPSTTAPTNVGDYTASASYDESSNHLGSSNSKDYSITKANQTITFATLSNKTYGDADFTVSATASSGLAVSFSASGNCTVTDNTVSITGAGSCTITASQGGDSNYNAASNVERTFSIAKAAATVTLSNLSYTYDGTAKSATASTNPGGLNVNITYNVASAVSSNPTDAGSYTVTATIDDPNYAGTASGTLVIAKASATVNVTGYTGTYDGNAHGATGSASGVQSEDLSGLLDLGASYTNAPGGTANWTFAGNNNYNSANGSVQIAIAKAASVITWSNPADIDQGTALSSTQLNASANTPGSFSYNPASGTVLPAGTHTLNVDFTPTDATNFNGSSASVSINVNAVAAALSITNVPEGTTFDLGKIYSYTVSVSNTGGSSAGGVVVSYPLPAGLSYNSVTASQGNCSFSSATNTVTCQLGTIAGGASASFVLKVKSRQEGTYSPTASYTSNVGTGSATAAQVTIVKYANLAVTKVDSVDPIYVGQQTTYTMTVKNLGPINSATGTALTDTLPSGMVFVSATATQGSLVTPPVDSGGIVTANLGTLALNATATVTVTVKATQAGTLVNTATVSSSEVDSNTSNNTVTQSTTVLPAVTLQKVLLSNQSPIGGCQPFPTGQVFLTSPAPAGGVTVNLSSTNAGVVVPAGWSVFIAAGQTKSEPFTVTTQTVTRRQDGNVVASFNGSTVVRSLQVYAGSCP
jgi:uncharacterized repeat protein (TIGR01451 family)